MTNHPTTNYKLIIFSRYPEPGKTKTRMIPALGAQGAAQLQRHMTEHTVAQARELQKYAGVTAEVHFAGGNEQLMQTWLGIDFVYKPQNSGNLGQRMASAYQDAFASGAQKVIMIGIDCPGVNAQLLSQGFTMLEQNDLVLGPAADGGYYLIGLRHFSTQLFQGISWGSGQVLQQTVAIAQQLNLQFTYLPVLEDVDRPEDLAVWYAQAK